MAFQDLAGESRLLACALAAVVGLVLLVARFQVNAFVSLILAAVFLGLCAGMNPAAIGGALQEGVGGVLGSVAVIIGLGAILGKLLAESGGAETIAATMVNALGDRRLHWTLAGAGFLVGIPVWFTFAWRPARPRSPSPPPPALSDRSPPIRRAPTSSCSSWRWAPGR